LQNSLFVFRTVPSDEYDAVPLSLSFLRRFDISAARASRARWRDAVQRDLQVLWMPAGVQRAGLLAGTAAATARRTDGYAIERRSRRDRVWCM